MNIERIKNSLFIKTICTLILPMFILGIVFSITIMGVSYEYPDMNHDFYESDNYRDNYLSYVAAVSRKAQQKQIYKYR